MGGGRRKRRECGPLKSGKRRDDIKEEEEERDVCQKMRPSFCDFLRGKGKRVARRRSMGALWIFCASLSPFPFSAFAADAAGGGCFHFYFRDVKSVS